MKLSNQRGLSLIEVLFAISIMAIVLGAITGGFSQAIKSGSFSKNQIAAMNDTKKMLEHVRMTADKKGLQGSGSVTDANYWSNPSGTGWLQTATFSNLPNATRSISFPDSVFFSHQPGINYHGNPNESYAANASSEPGPMTKVLHVRASVNWQEKGGPKSYYADTLITNRAEPEPPPVTPPNTYEANATIEPVVWYA